MLLSTSVGFRCAAVFSFAIALAGSCRGDVILKKDGGKLTGTVVEAESDETFLAVKGRFGTQKIRRGDIKSIQFTSEVVEDYKQASARFKDTAEDQFKLALWCNDNKYRKEYQKHLERTVMLEPDHPEARRRLGQKLHEGKWLTPDQIKESQGYVRHGGRWVLPQEKEEAEATEASKKSRQDWYRKIKVWRALLNSDKAEKRLEGSTGFKGIKDPQATKPLFDTLTDKKSTESERLLLVEALTGIEGNESTSALVKIAMLDRVDENRATAATALKERKSPTLLGDLLKYLKDNDNEKVNFAAAILGEVGDSSVYAPMIDAIITKHKYVHEPSFLEMAKKMGPQSYRLGGSTVNPDGSISGPSVMTRLQADREFQAWQRQNTQGGGYNFNQPQTTVTVEEKKNAEVIQALQKLTGENFGYDKQRWFKWIRDNDREKSAKLDK